jgi:hypothetical protein
MQQLIELRLGSSTEEVYGYNNIFILEKFREVLSLSYGMPKLAVLEMQLPHVRHFTISRMSTYLLPNVGIGHRGTKFVTSSLRNLTYLSICKQWNDSDNNKIGY